MITRISCTKDTNATLPTSYFLLLLLTNDSPLYVSATSTHSIRFQNLFLVLHLQPFSRFYCIAFFCIRIDLPSVHRFHSQSFMISSKVFSLKELPSLADCRVASHLIFSSYCLMVSVYCLPKRSVATTVTSLAVAGISA